MLDSCIEPQLKEAEYNEESEYFFRRIGEIALTREEALSLAVASRYGVIVLADGTCVRVARTASLVPLLQKWDNDQSMPVKDIVQISGVSLNLQGSQHVFFSSDASLLAVVCSHEVYVFSTYKILKENGVLDLGKFSFFVRKKFDTKIRQFGFRYIDECDPMYAVLLDDDTIAIRKICMEEEDLTGNECVISSPSGGKMSCFTWSPSCNYLAVAQSSRNSELSNNNVEYISFYQISESSSGIRASVVSTVHIKSIDVDESSILSIDGMAWVHSNSILVDSRIWMEKDSSLHNFEASDTAVCGILSWQRNDSLFAPANSEETIYEEFFPNNIDGICGNNFFSLENNIKIDCITEWGLCVFAHKYSSDDHIKLFSICHTSIPSSAMGIEFSEDKLAIRIPNALGDKSNFVLGLGFDTSKSYTTKEPHPIDCNAPDLPSQPVLWIITSDGILRCYVCGNMERLEEIVGKRDQAVIPDRFGKSVSQIATSPPDISPNQVIKISKQSMAACVPLSESDDDELQTTEGSSKAGLTERYEGIRMGISSKDGAAQVTPFESNKLSLQQDQELVSLSIKEKSSKKSTFDATPPAATEAISNFPEATDIPNPLNHFNPELQPKESELEQHFNKDIKKTRELEVEVYDTFRMATLGAMSCAKKKFDDSQGRIVGHLKLISSMLESIEDISKKFQNALGILRISKNRMGAMLSFSSADEISKVSTPENLPSLPPQLSIQRKQALNEIKVIQSKLSDVEHCLRFLESSQSGLSRSSTGKFKQEYKQMGISEAESYSLALLEAVNSQWSVIRDMSSRILLLQEIAKSLGVRVPTKDNCIFGESDIGVDTDNNRLFSKSASPVSHFGSRHVHLPWRSTRDILNSKEGSIFIGDSLHSERGSKLLHTGNYEVLDSNEYPEISSDQEKMLSNILNKVRGTEGGVRITSYVPISDNRSNLSQGNTKAKNKKSKLPCLNPLSLPELTEPYMPSCPSENLSEFLLQEPKFAPQSAASYHPPLPSASQLAASQSLMSKAGIKPTIKAPAGKASENIGPGFSDVVAKPVQRNASQPPLPSASQLAASQSLMSKAGFKPVKSTSSKNGQEPTSSSSFVSPSSGGSQGSPFSSLGAAGTPTSAGKGAFGSFGNSSNPSSNIFSSSDSVCASNPFGEVGLKENETGSTGLPTSGPVAQPFGFGQQMGKSQGLFSSGSNVNISSNVPMLEISQQSSTGTAFGKPASIGTPTTVSPFGQQAQLGPQSIGGMFGRPAAIGSTNNTGLSQSISGFDSFAMPHSSGSKDFGSVSSPGTGVFGSASSNDKSGFGSFASSGATGFGAIASSGTGVFGSVSNSQAGFGSFANSGAAGFGAVASSNQGFLGGFASNNQSAGFGAFSDSSMPGQSRTTGFGAGTKPQTSNSMWEMRK